MNTDRKKAYLRGVRDGIPIMLGYFAVSITLGIAARNAGMTPFQATLTSLLINASAGEFIGFTLISAGAGYLEVMLMEAIANARYLLMSCALSQKLDARTPFISPMKSLAFPLPNPANSTPFIPMASSAWPLRAGRWEPCWVWCWAISCPCARSAPSAWDYTACLSPFLSLRHEKTASLPDWSWSALLPAMRLTRWNGLQAFPPVSRSSFLR